MNRIRKSVLSLVVTVFICASFYMPMSFSDIKTSYIVIPGGCGSQHCIGETLNVELYINWDGYYTLTSATAWGEKAIFQNRYYSSGVYVLPGVVGEPEGEHILKLYELWEGDPVLDDSCNFYAVKCGCPDGFLWIHCNEYEYDLYVDGSYRLTEGHGSGKSTSSKPDGICGVKLPAGDHTIKLKKDGCDTVTKSVHIGCGEEKTIYVNMECDPCKNKNCDQYDGYVGDYYCKNGDVYRKYRDYYCEDGKCKYREEERKIEDCEYGCEDGGCIIDPCKNKNCDQYDGYVGEKYCKNGNVYQKYRDYYCDKGECKYREEERKIKDCDYGCENGGCVSIPNRQNLLNIARERKETYQKLKEALDQEKVCLRIQEEYSTLYKNMWGDLLETSIKIDDLDILSGLFNMSLNAISRLEEMGKLSALQNHLNMNYSIYNPLRNSIEDMCNLIDEEIKYLEQNDISSLRNIYTKENQLANTMIIQISYINSELEELMKERVTEGENPILESYQLELRKNESDERWIDISDADHFHVFIITRRGFTYTKGEFKVEIYDEFGTSIGSGTPFVYSCVPSSNQLQFGTDAVKVTNFYAYQQHYSKFKVKITCLEEQKLLWIFSKPAKIEVLVHMKLGSSPEKHPTDVEKYIYKNLSGVMDTLEKLIDAERKYRAQI